jgi:hypothetical protein
MVENKIGSALVKTIIWSYFRFSALRRIAPDCKVWADVFHFRERVKKYQ